MLPEISVYWMAIPAIQTDVSGKIIATTPIDSDPDNTVVTKGIWMHN